MKVSKRTFKDNPPQAWLSIEDEDTGEHIGTFHTRHPELVQRIRQHNGAIKIKFEE